MKDLGHGYYVNLKILDNGNLEITPTPDALAESERFLSLATQIALDELFEDWICNGWGWVQPEQIGALTAAPIITDEFDIDDDGKFIANGNIWWFFNYAVENEVENLLKNGKLIFTKAEK
ncbi:MAG: hypothetical protein WC755_09050 [Candidatus Woesearchaeota archaeon]